jgi:hypothetical protein
MVSSNAKAVQQSGYTRLDLGELGRASNRSSKSRSGGESEDDSGGGLHREELKVRVGKECNVIAKCEEA